MVNVVREITTGCSEKHVKARNALCEQNTKLLDLKIHGTLHCEASGLSDTDTNVMDRILNKKDFKKGRE